MMRNDIELFNTIYCGRCRLNEETHSWRLKVREFKTTARHEDGDEASEWKKLEAEGKR